MLATDAKNWKNPNRSEFILDGRKFRRQCVNVIDIMWGRIYFSMCEHFERKTNLKWLQACGSNVCGHEVILKTGASPPEEHYWTLAEYSLVGLQSKQVCGWCSQYRTALCSVTSRQTRNLCDLTQNWPTLTQLSMATSVCQWIKGFLSVRQQLVKLRKFSSSTRTISTGVPQGCVLSQLLFSLYINDCTSKDTSVKPLKFADDTTLIGIIQDSDKSAYRQ